MEIITTKLILHIIFAGIGCVLGVVLGVFIYSYEEDEDFSKKEIEINKMIVCYLLERLKIKNNEEIERGKHESN